MKILLAVDPTLPHEDLVQHVTSRLWPKNAEFSVVAVVEDVPDEFLPASVPDLMTRASGHAEERVELTVSCLKASGLNALPYVLEGDPHDSITEEAIVLKSDLILLGAPRREDGFPFLNSRIARAILRHAPCSVQIVRTGTLRKVLVPTDGSEFSLAAARSIAARQWPEGCEFRVMSVVEPISASVRFLYPPHTNSIEAGMLREEAIRHTQKAIAATEKILADAGLAVSDHVLVPIDSANKLIIQEATGWNADLIVMGCHGRRGIKRLLIGSVSESVAIHSECSVEVIR
jgi:nucleotide-binding universal stress UspA family protein